MRKQLLFYVLLWVVSSAFAQNSGFNYKAIIYDNGSLLQNQAVDVQFTIFDESLTTIFYQEIHTTTTDTNGIINLLIGEGTPNASYDFNTLVWNYETVFLQVEIDTGSGYQDFGTNKLKYVPYAKYAEEAGNVPTNVSELVNDSGYISTEVDGSTTNELQTISKSGNTVTLSNGGGSFTDADTQLTETQVDNFVANNGYLTTEIDGSTTNELQTLSLSGNALTISNGNMVTLPENTYYAGTGIQINPGNVISNTGDADADATNELQTISKSGNTVTLSNGGGSFTDEDTQLTETQVDNFVSNNGYLTSETDGDATNELQTLSLSGNVLSISDGNNVTLPSSSGSDVDFLEIGTGQAPDNILDDIYHTGNISFGHATTPNAKLDIKNTGTSTAVNSNTGIKITNNNSSNTDKIGVNTLLDAAGTAKVYGAKTNIVDTANGDIYGTHTTIGGFNGDGDHFGNYFFLTGEGTGTHTGSRIILSTNGSPVQTGNDIELYTISNVNTAVQTGVKTHIYGFGTGPKYAIDNLIDGDSEGYIFGVKNVISNTANGKHYGMYNALSGSGTNSHYGAYTTISGSGSGSQIGYAINNYNSGNGAHYGLDNFIYGGGSGEHIGVKNQLSGSGSGRQIGVEI